MTPSADAQPGECNCHGVDGWHSRFCPVAPNTSAHTNVAGLQDGTRHWVRATATAPVWRPCANHPEYSGLYTLRYQGGDNSRRENAKWDGQQWLWITGRPIKYPGDFEWLDPAPGHEEQVQFLGHDIDPYSDTCSRCSKHRQEIVEKSSFRCLPRREQVNAAQERPLAATGAGKPGEKGTTSPAAAPTIEQDRQALLAMRRDFWRLFGRGGKL